VERIAVTATSGWASIWATKDHPPVEVHHPALGTRTPAVAQVTDPNVGRLLSDPWGELVHPPAQPYHGVLGIPTSEQLGSSAAPRLSRVTASWPKWRRWRCG
jgi:hypothetical protein